MRKITVILTCVLLFVSCGKVDQDTAKEYKDTSLKLQMLRNSRLEYQNKYDKQSSVNRQEKDLINRRNLYFVNTMVKLFYKKNNRYPEFSELQKFGVPAEIYSGLSTLSTNRDGTGGWYYDRNKGEFNKNDIKSKEF